MSANRGGLFSADEMAKLQPEITLDRFKEAVQASKILREEKDRIGATLDMSDPSFRQKVMQMASLTNVIAMGEEMIKLYMPIMEKKYGYVVPECDRPGQPGKIYGVKTKDDHVEENVEEVKSPSMRK